MNKIKSDLEAEHRNSQHHEELKNMAISEMNMLTVQLEEERHKTQCQICMDNPRDVLLMPCMHFLYCNACMSTHEKNSKTCPACRSPVAGVMKCNLST